MKNTVLVITTEPDPHIAMVVKYLPEVSFLTIDPKTFPKLSMSFFTDVTGSKVILGDKDVTEVSVIWYRKPLFKEPKDLSIPDSFKNAVIDNYTAFVKWMYNAFPQAFWISDPWNIFKGNSKIYQMQLAQRMGFRVPATLLTSDAVEARKFVDSLNTVVVKPIRLPTILDGKVYRAMYTCKVNKDTIKFEGLSLTPSIFQEAVAGVDIRVTVVGDKVFPCRILKTGDAQREIDWRVSQIDGNLEYEEDTHFPTDLAHLCVKMTREMGLEYGAFDFIEHDGFYYFLEINPNGQWGFIEEKGGLEISKAFAELINKHLN